MSIKFVNGYPIFTNATINYGDLDNFLSGLPFPLIIGAEEVSLVSKIKSNIISNSVASAELSTLLPYLAGRSDSITYASVLQQALTKIKSNIESSTETSAYLELIINTLNYYIRSNIDSNTEITSNLDSITPSIILNSSSYAHISALLSSLVKLQSNIDSSTLSNVILEVITQIQSNIDSNSIVNAELSTLASYVEGQINSITYTNVVLKIINSITSNINSNSEVNSNLISLISSLLLDSSSETVSNCSVTTNPVSITLSNINSITNTSAFVSYIAKLIFSSNSSTLTGAGLSALTNITGNINSTTFTSISIIGSYKPIILKGGELAQLSDDTVLDAGGITITLTLAKLTENGTEGFIKIQNGIVISVQQST